MTDHTPLECGLATSPDDELVLTPADQPVVGLGIGLTPEGEAVPLIKITFIDPMAGPCSLTLDTRTGHAERVYSVLHRLLHAIHNPDEHPDDAREVERMLRSLIDSATEGDA